MYYSKEWINKTIREYLLDVYKINVEQLNHGMYFDKNLKKYSITDIPHDPQVIYNAKYQKIFYESDIKIWMRNKKISNIKKRINQL